MVSATLFWQCPQNLRQEFAEFDPTAPHSHEMCMGGCSTHPLMRPEFLYSWEELDERERKLKAAAMTETDRQNALIEVADEKLEREMSKASLERDKYARHVKERAQMGQKKGAGPKKIQQPCKWVVGQFSSDECWAFEYTDPKTGVRERPHTCERLHPGEEGWCCEWLKNPRFEPAGAENRFSGIAAGMKRSRSGNALC